MNKVLEANIDEFEKLMCQDICGELSLDESRRYNFLQNMILASIGLKDTIAQDANPHFRLPIDMPVEFPEQPPMLKGRAEDISSRAVYVSVDYDFHIDDELELNLFPSDGAQPIRIKGKIVRKDGSRGGIVVEFGNDSEAERLCSLISIKLRELI